MVLPQIAPPTAPPVLPGVRLAQRSLERKRIIPRQAAAVERAWPPPQGQWGSGQIVASEVLAGFEIAVDAIFAV